MRKDYLESLSVLSEAERNQIRATGVASPAALLSAMEASPEPYRALLGPFRFSELKKSLENIISSEERQHVGAADTRNFGLGAVVEGSPREIRRTSLHDERDRIYDEIMELERSGDCSTEVQQKLQELRDELDKLHRAA